MLIPPTRCAPPARRYDDVDGQDEESDSDGDATEAYERALAEEQLAAAIMVSTHVVLLSLLVHRVARRLPATDLSVLALRGKISSGGQSVSM